MSFLVTASVESQKNDSITVFMAAGRTQTVADFTKDLSPIWESRDSS